MISTNQLEHHYYVNKFGFSHVQNLYCNRNVQNQDLTGLYLDFYIEGR